MAARRWRVFLDTSALIAGLISQTGAAREVLRLCEAGVIETLVSKQVLTEADRNLSEKLPGLAADYRRLIQSIAPTLLDDPTREEISRVAGLIHSNDAPILAAAIAAEADYLVSWNTKHFHQPKVRQAVRFQIVTPGELLVAFRNSLPEG
ncbi:MAG: putative toxin-antitoxin system toxin component, PIN family [Nitrospirota bacterium]